MISSSGLALGSVVAEVSGWPLILGVMLTTFAVQLAGTVIAWRSAPVGAMRLSICIAFSAVWIASFGLLVAGWIDTVMYPLHIGLLFGLALQGYQCLWRGRS